MSETRKLPKKPEILVPAGSPDSLRAAIRYGADAVYLGGEAFSLRAMARNFPPEAMEEGIAFAHKAGVKVYVTANIFAHNADLAEAREYFAFLKKIGPDALIMSDPGLIRICRQVWPEVQIHLSTQANNTNYETFLFWYDLGIRRVVSARELSLSEIRELRAHLPEDMEIESFVHGAMCISYSGRCLLSATLTGRDANHGACTHPCRWKYAVMEESRPGEYFPIEENERGTFVFNSRDLCMIEHIPELVEAGIGSFKIEGRMKNALYVATVARTYRKALDDYYESTETYERNLDFYREQIAMCTFRSFGTGFYFGRPSGGEDRIFDGKSYMSEAVYLGIAEEVSGSRIVFRQKNKFCVGDEIEVMKPDGTDGKLLVKRMIRENGEEAQSCPHAGEKIVMECESLGGAFAEPGDVLRIRGSR